MGRMRYWPEVYPRITRSVRDCRLAKRISLARSIQFERPLSPHPSPLPKEREPLFDRFLSSLDGDWIVGCQMVLPLLGERVGVRGKKMPNCIVLANATPNRTKVFLGAGTGTPRGEVSGD